MLNLSALELTTLIVPKAIYIHTIKNQLLREKKNFFNSVAVFKILINDHKYKYNQFNIYCR